MCLEVQETESANVVTFSPYYHGCVPLLVINHFCDLSLRFAQNIKYVREGEGEGLQDWVCRGGWG